MALEVSAAIIGILAAAGKVAETLGPIVSAFVQAPKHAQSIIVEIEHTRTILRILGGLFEELATVPRRRRKLVPLDQLITALTNGVLIFSELEGLANQLGDPNDAVSSRTRWARKEHELDKLVSRLTGFKTSMALMLGILQCESDLIARYDRQELLSHQDRILQHNRDLSQRLARVESHFDTGGSAITKQPASLCSTVPTHHDPGSAVTVDNWRVSSMTQLETARVFAFERVLKASRVYRRAKRPTDDRSFRSSIPLSHAWTALSDISLSDISAISVVALPLAETDISNGHHYTFAELIDNDNSKIHPDGDDPLEDDNPSASSQSSRLPFDPAVSSEDPTPKSTFRRSDKLKVIVKGTVEADLYGLFEENMGEHVRPEMLLYDDQTYQRSLIVNGHSIHLDIDIVIDVPGIWHVGRLHDEQIRAGDLFIFVFNRSSRTSFERIQHYPQHVHYHKQATTVPMMVIDNPGESRLYRNEPEMDEEEYFAAKEGCSFLRMEEATPEALRDALVHLVEAKWAIEEQEDMRQKQLRDPIARGLPSLTRITEKTRRGTLRKRKPLAAILETPVTSS